MAQFSVLRLQPGPNWHAKRDRAPTTYHAMPALVRVRVKR
jgi:hypothetical protein